MLTRNVLLKQALSRTGGTEMLAWLAVVEPGGSSGRHSHPYDEFAYIIEGTFVLEVDGEEPVAFKAGECGRAPANTIHVGRNGSTEHPCRALVFGLTAEGEPLVVPAG